MPQTYDFLTNGNGLLQAIEDARIDSEDHAQAENSFTDVDGNSFQKGAKGWSLEAKNARQNMEALSVASSRTIYLDQNLPDENPLFADPSLALSELRSLVGSGNSAVLTVGYKSTNEPYVLKGDTVEFFKANVSGYYEQPEDTLIQVRSPVAETQRHRFLFGRTSNLNNLAFDVNLNELPMNINLS